MFRSISSRLATCALALCLSPMTVDAQQFGGSSAIRGGDLFVGEAGQNVLPGIVYLYRESAEGWREAGQLRVTADGGDPDGFGRAIAADELGIIVGAPLSDDGAGAAYLFVSNDGDWAESGRLEAPEGGAFGSVIAVDGAHAVFAAPGASEGAGAVYPMHRTNGTWVPNGRLAPEGAAPGFGSTMAMADGLLLVSTGNRFGQTGEVYSFTLDDGGRWTAAGQLEVQGLADRNGFGAALAINDGRAYVGATGQGTGGAVFVLARDEDGWSVERRIGPFDASPRAAFGSSIAFDGETLLIGAPGDGDGVLYAFEGAGENGYAMAFRAGAANPHERGRFGSSLTVAGDVSLIGSSGVDENAGATFVYERLEASGWTEQTMLANESRGFSAMVGDEVTCDDNQAAIFECSEVSIASFLPIKDIGGGRGTRVNDIWGWTDPETGREYAIVGRTNGTSFVDISDPYNPLYLGDLPKTEGSRSMIWRDIKVHADHAYIVADGAGEHGVQVFDLRRLRDVSDAPVTFDEDFLYDGIHSAHNIVINEDTGFAYTVGNSGGGETCGGGYHMLDLTDPQRPTFAGCFADAETGRSGTGYSHDAQCVVYHGPDAEHVGKEICLGSNETMLNIADVTDKDAPVSLANQSYPSVAYAHQGWLTDDHRYFYMNDEGDEPQGLVEGTRTLVWDVTDLDDPILVNEYIADTPDTDHNLYVVGDLMYQSNYGAGLRILDISDPVNPEEIAFFDNSPYGGASWSNYPFFKSGIIAVTGTGDGLFLLKNTARELVP